MKLTKTQRKALKALNKTQGRISPREEALERGAGKLLGFVLSPNLEPCVDVEVMYAVRHFNKFSETYHMSHNNDKDHRENSIRYTKQGEGVPMPWPRMLQHIKQGEVVNRYS